MDFDNSIKIKGMLLAIDYFKDWSDEQIDNCCELSKIKTYKEDELVLNDGYGETTFVYFIIDGCCEILELVRRKSKNGKIKQHYVKIYQQSKSACFNIGENHKNRDFVAITPTVCLLIPYYWLKKYFVNLWRIAQFLDFNIPKSAHVFENLSKEMEWRHEKQALTGKRVNQLHNIPYSIRIKNCPH